MDWTTTTTLLRDLRDFQNQSAWERLAARFRKPIVSFARGLGLSSTDSDDVAQEALLAFAEAFRGGQYDPARGRLSQWLFGIAYRQALGVRRRTARAGRGIAANVDDGSGTAQLENIADETAASAMWDQEWEKSILEECLERVREEVEPETFAAFDLVVNRDYDAERAAETLGVNIKLVYNAKHRVLKRIRELRDEFENTA